MIFTEKPHLSSQGQRELAAFTLTEVMVATAVLTMAMAGSLLAHLFGARMNEITKSKLGANQEAREAINLMVDEIRSAKTVEVGNGGLSGFTQAAAGTQQAGTAIQIYPGTDTNDFVRYFWDSGDKQLKRTVDGTNSLSIVAHFITNSVVFSAERWDGTVLTNNDNNRVIGLTLQFYQMQYPIITIGPGSYYDFYQLRTKITRRALE